MIRRLPFSLLWCVALLPLAACASHEQGTQTIPSEVFAGHVTTSSSEVWFTPCAPAGADKFWVTFTGASVQQAERAKSAGLLGTERTFVRWSAARTNEQHAGPGGPALLVRDILEVRAPRPDDCSPR